MYVYTFVCLYPCFCVLTNGNKTSQSAAVIPEIPNTTNTKTMAIACNLLFNLLCTTVRISGQ